MKIISIGFKNPFQESGYSDTIKINNLDDINVFIGKNNSGKTNILRSIYNLLHQDIDRSNIFRRLTVKLNLKDFELILEKFHNALIKIYKNRDISSPEINSTVNRLKITLKDGKFVNGFYPLINLIKDYPIPPNFSMIFNFNNDIPNEKLLFDYIFDNINDLNEDIHKLVEDILKKVSLDQDLIRILIKHFLPFKKIILIPSFRTLETSEKKYTGEEITEITRSIAALIDSSFDRIPINAQRSDPFKIPNLALMLSIIKEQQMVGEYKKIMNPEFFTYFNSSLKKIFPDIDLFIDFQLTELTTKGGYKEFGRNMGDWTKLGHGTQQLISLLFLLILPRDCVYIIDEPENGLHSGLQSRLLQFIKHIILTDSSYNKQFFFASHSTSFIDFSGKCSHFICKKDKEKFSIDLLEKEKLQLIRNELGLKPSSLLQANGVIWVEGVSGKPYLNMLFQCFGINLDELGVIIIHFGGGDDITSNHYTIDLLESLNPNFCIIIDSEKNDIDDELDEVLNEIKVEYEERDHLFWIIEKFRNIEGIIPQEVINEYFDIGDTLKQENLKKPFENLTSYIKRLKDPSVGIIPADRKKYKKTRDAPRICELIKSNPDYRLKIKENKYLHEKIKRIEKEIEKWSHIELFIHDKSNNKASLTDIELMREQLNQFLTAETNKDTHKIADKFKTWGLPGINFLLKEYRTNKFGHSSTSASIMDISYPSVEEQEYYPETYEERILDSDIINTNIQYLNEQLNEEKHNNDEEIRSLDSKRKHLIFSFNIIPINLTHYVFDFNDANTITAIKNIRDDVIYSNPYGGMYDIDEFLRDFRFQGDWYQADYVRNSDMIFNFGRTKVHKNGIISMTIAIQAYPVNMIKNSILFLDNDEKLLNSIWINTDLLAYLIMMWLKLIRTIYSKLEIHGNFKLILDIYSGWDLSLVGKNRILKGNHLNPKSEIDVKISELNDNKELLDILQSILKELLRYFGIDIDRFEEGYSLFEKTIDRYFGPVFGEKPK